MFKEFFDQSEIPAAIFNDQGNLLYCNERFESLTLLKGIKKISDFEKFDFVTGQADPLSTVHDDVSRRTVVNSYSLPSGGSLVVSFQKINPSYDISQHVLLAKFRIKSAEYRETIYTETEAEKELLAFVKPDGTIKFISHSINELTGKRSALLMGTPYVELIYREDRALFTAHFNEVLEGTTARFQFRLLKHDGKILWFDCVIKPLIDVSGVVKNSQISCRDITPQVQIHQQQEEHLFQERQLNEAKSQFIATASHQLNTPISVIKSNTKLIEQIWNDDSGKKQKILERVNSSVSKLVEIVNDLLLMEKVKSGKVAITFEKCDLVELISENNRQEYSQLDEKRNLDIQVIGETRLIEIDKKLFEHIITNLVTNAFKYSKDRKEPKLTMDYTNSEHVAISVVDYGIGIAENEFDKIFSPFFRSQTTTEKGVGLGLSIVKNFVDLLNWDIAFDSKLNEHTTFTLKIPG